MKLSEAIYEPLKENIDSMLDKALDIMSETDVRTADLTIKTNIEIVEMDNGSGEIQRVPVFTTTISSNVKKSVKESVVTGGDMKLIDTDCGYELVPGAQETLEM